MVDYAQPFEKYFIGSVTAKPKRAVGSFKGYNSTFNEQNTSLVDWQKTSNRGHSRYIQHVI
ncbi:hypothetical protein [Glaciecola sp. MF2-115]|uniref:hypothetical protein n=1 Tax=Glaciecola sp. MF2-115 TaxID=3384827 RepID=UPI0039A32AEA